MEIVTLVKNHWKLLLIVFTAFVLRFYALGLNPPSLTWDEAAWGYNAYSLSTDGRDEFGRFLPHDYIESFGDFKPPMYAYLDIVPIKLFGVNNFAVRFPSALFGTLTVLFTYFLVKRIFDKSKLTNKLALFSALFLAVSPWHIMLSRAAFEANIVTFFIVLGVWLFLLGIWEKSWYLIFSISAFVLSLYTFNTARIVSPLLVLILTIGFWRELRRKKKMFIISCIIGVLLLLPTAKFLLSPQASLRFQEVNIFANLDVVERSNQEIKNDQNNMLSKAIHNRRLAYGAEFLKHYFDHFNPQFLFISGDINSKFSTQDVGQLYLFELPFFLIGAFFLFKQRIGHWWIIPLWMMLGIIPAATARETPHALRIETTLPTFQMLVAFGVVLSLQSLQNYKVLMKRYTLIRFILFFLLTINVFYFLHGYVAHYASERSRDWQYGFSQSAEYAKSVGNKYNKIYFAEEMGRPYIYALLYMQYDPKKFRKEAIVDRDVFGFVDVKAFGKYHFERNIKTYYSKEKDALFIEYVESKRDILEKIPKEARIQKIIREVNGAPVIIIYS